MLVVGHSGSSLETVSKDFAAQVSRSTNNIKMFNLF
jgi:hypothetical protein